MSDELRDRIADAINFHPGNRGGDPDQRHRASLEFARIALRELRPELDELTEYRAAIARVRQVHRTVPDLDGRPMCAAECEAVPCPTIRALDLDATEAETAPEFPLPIRPDGSHAYLSSYCAHGDHAACRLRCKTCAADCLCDCGHPDAPSCRWPACLSERQHRLLAAQVDAGMRGEPTVPMPDQRIVCGCVDRGIGDEGLAELAAAEAALPTQATMPGGPADKAATSGDAPDKALPSDRNDGCER